MLNREELAENGWHGSRKTCQDYVSCQFCRILFWQQQPLRRKSKGLVVTPTANNNGCALFFCNNTRAIPPTLITSKAPKNNMNSRRLINCCDARRTSPLLTEPRRLTVHSTGAAITMLLLLMSQLLLGSPSFHLFLCQYDHQRTDRRMWTMSWAGWELANQLTWILSMISLPRLIKCFPKKRGGHHRTEQRILRVHLFGIKGVNENWLPWQPQNMPKLC
jgi:hypothetical protein